MPEYDPELLHAVDAAYAEVFRESESSEVMPVHGIDNQLRGRLVVDFTPPAKDEVGRRVLSPEVAAHEVAAAAIGNTTLAGLIDSLNGQPDDSFDYDLETWSDVIK